jgi:hypothetical protein
MADFGIYTKNADIQALAGINADATAKATAATDVYVLNVEAKINSMTRYNWSDAYTAGLNVDVKGILTETGAAFCAINVINANMSGYSSRSEAETMLDVLRDIALTNISILRDIKTQTFIIGA